MLKRSQVRYSAIGGLIVSQAMIGIEFENCIFFNLVVKDILQSYFKCTYTEEYSQRTKKSQCSDQHIFSENMPCVVF